MAIINYRVTYVSTPASGSVIVTATTFTLDSLPAGTIVTFSVAAQSAVGFGAESSVLQATAGIPPSAPTGLTATAGNARIDLSWTAPSSDGGSAITGYAVEYTRSGYPPETVSTGSTSTIYPLTGLTNGEAYTVRVAAVNAAGPGAYTAASSSVTPAPPPPITRNNGSGSGTSASKWTLATVYPACDFQGRFITANSAVTVLVDSVNSVGCGCDAGEIWNIAHRNASGTLLSGIHDNYNQTFLGKSFTLSAGDYLYVDIQCAINTYRAWVP
jgi:predicted phage tail protein